MSDQTALKEQIDATRAELGDTVEALAAKTDVKGRVREKLHGTHAGDAAGQVGRRVRRHPGRAWLLAAVAGAYALGRLSGGR